MPRRRRNIVQQETPEPDVQWVDELPDRQITTKGIWVERLEPVMTRPGNWAKVYEADSVESAQDHADNLRRRKVIIPEPTHEWSFASRGLEVFANYRGVRPNAGVRRTQRRR